VIYYFAHRINNVLKLAFYLTPQKKAKQILLASTTPAKKQSKKMQIICDSSSDSSLSDDDTATPSPSKYVEANTLLLELSSKSKEVLTTITTSKKLVKYIKLVSKTSNSTKRFISLSIELSFIKVGLNKSIQDLGGVALKQETVVRWLSLSNMLESIDASIEHIRSILSSKSSSTQYSFRLNSINTDALKDLIRLLNEFKNVSLLVQTGNRPSLHMAYICINKLEHHLNGTDVDANGDVINIDDRHEGNNKRNHSGILDL
jgi:hypothetical protein